MSEERFAAFIKFLFAQERKQYTIPPDRIQQRLAGLLEKAGDTKQEAKGCKK